MTQFERPQPPAGPAPSAESPAAVVESLALTGSPDLFLRARTPQFRQVALALAAAGFSTYALLYCVQPLLPVFSDDLGVSPSVSSLSLSVTTVALAVDDAGRRAPVRRASAARRPMAISLFAVGLLTIAAAFAPSWPSLLAIRALTGRRHGRRALGGDGLPRRGGAPARPRRRHGHLHRRQRLRRHGGPRAHRLAHRRHRFVAPDAWRHRRVSGSRRPCCS